MKIFTKRSPVTVYEFSLGVHLRIGPDIANLAKPAELAGKASEQRRCCLTKFQRKRRLQPNSHTRRGVVARKTRQNKQFRPQEK